MVSPWHILKRQSRFFVPSVCASVAVGIQYGPTSKAESTTTPTLTAPGAFNSGRCVVLGSGIIGLATAYYLKRTGAFQEIHVIDREKECCRGCSFQNGGVINTEAITPVNAYMSIFATVRLSLRYMLFGTSTNTLITWRALLEPPGLLLRWVWYFWQSCAEETIMRNAQQMLDIGNVTGQLFEDVFKDLALNEELHNFSKAPGLILFHAADPEKLVAAKHARFGSVKRKQFVTGDELDVVKQESNLLGLVESGCNVGCVEPHNYKVNSRTLGKSFCKHLRQQGVVFHHHQDVARVALAPDGKRVAALVLSDGSHLEADSFVLCAGYETCYLLGSIGVSLPLAPVKAYSLHINNCAVAPKLKYATLVEASPHCLITPYGDTSPPSVRVTGLRDLDGFNNIMRKERLSALMDGARSYLGSDFDTDKDVDVWAGVMGVSPDDFPIVGKLERFQNLYVNVGHGFRGTNWSLASAKVLSQVMVGDRTPILNPLSFAPSRFGA